ncbi:MAG: glycosyltransferase [Clostridia bacterium]|nr:glycosyltransferase [Clostridia bacterium]
MTHVVQVLTDTNIGGAGKYLLNYLDGFDRTTFRVTVILPEGSKLSEYVKNFPDVTLMEAPYMADQSYNKRCVTFLKALFQKIKPDILHTHACLSARIAGKKTKVPVVLATRHCLEPRPRGIKALAYSALNNALCDYYIAVSDAVVTNLVDAGITIDKIRTVNNGVKPIPQLPAEARAYVRSCYGIAEDEIAFGIFGRLEPVKGHKYFIKAAWQVLKEYPKAKFLIVGSGSMEQTLKELVKHYNLENNVIFTGFVPDTTELLNAVDINVCTSESEAMSLAILEAMSLGKPSIATKVGGNFELISDSEDGILVNYANSTALALAMLRLICNPDLKALLGTAAQQKYAQGYTVQKMVDRLESVYREVMK